jgi:hypothetical protein
VSAASAFTLSFFEGWLRISSFFLFICRNGFAVLFFPHLCMCKHAMFLFFILCVSVLLYCCVACSALIVNYYSIFISVCLSLSVSF